MRTHDGGGNQAGSLERLETMKLQRVLEEFDAGYNCCQAVLLVFGEHFGVSREMAARLGTPFVAGMGYSGHTCGALVGAMMVLGLAGGRLEAGDQVTEKRLSKEVRALLGAFEKRQGASACRELRSAHRRLSRFFDRDRPFMEAHCRSCVLDAAELLQGLLRQRNA